MSPIIHNKIVIFLLLSKIAYTKFSGGPSVPNRLPEVQKIFILFHCPLDGKQFTAAPGFCYKCLCFRIVIQILTQVETKRIPTASAPAMEMVSELFRVKLSMSPTAIKLEA